MIKKILGVLIMILAPSVIVFMFLQAKWTIYSVPEGIARTNLFLQWGTILFIFIPIFIALGLFGYYAVKGEYDDI